LEFGKEDIEISKSHVEFAIEYKKSGEKLVAYTNSDWAGDIDDRKSYTGNIVMLAGDPVNWKSKKQTSISLSTMEAEYVALCEMSKEIVYMKRLLTNRGLEKY
jgi:hypothetical protein